VAAPADIREIVVSGEPARARSTAVEALESRGFALTWTDEWACTAETGTRGRQLLLGGFAPHVQVGLSLHAVDVGSVVRLTRASTGMSGGLMGRAKAVKQFDRVAGDLSAVFSAAGVLISPPPA
jgi:hypothetical protein